MAKIAKILTAVCLCLILSPDATIAVAVRRNMEEEAITEWVNSLRWMQPGITSFDLTTGDSLGLDCGSRSHVGKIRATMALEWRLFDRKLSDEGPKGRVQLLESNGRLTVENINERDSGLYAAYVSSLSLARVLDLSAVKTVNGSEVKEIAGRMVTPSGKEIGDQLTLCIFVVRVDKLRAYAMREGQKFALNASNWLKPIADTLDALHMAQDEWSLTWVRENEGTATCKRIAKCELKFNGSRELSAGIWRLELRSLVDAKSERRVLLEFTLTVKPALTHLETFPLATHQNYMVLGSLLIALCLLSLHLFNNLNWTPFAFDVLPDQVSPKAVLDQAGVFLKDSRV